ncbi:MAG: PD-(D/E)XK nuclease family protein [Ruminococcus sp.]|jgi:ATP-dependent helicase/nuclease subunit B|nr:PD-(D/E)XK nuclease family protein [Ruminococcus sp.]
MNFILGASGTGKTAEVIRLAAERITLGEKVLIIVPEQFSFEFERLMYESVGLKIFNTGLSVCSFTKLSESIFDFCGGGGGKYASEAVKSVILYRALQKLTGQKSLRAFEKRIKYPSFRAKILKALRELSDNRIEPENLRNRFGGGGEGLPDKIADITEIYAEYVHTLKESGYRDGINRHFDAARIAASNGFFADKTVFIDSFFGFTADEREIIKAAAMTAKELYISLCTDSIDRPFGVFESVNRTRDRIAEDIQNAGLPVRVHNLPNINRRFTNADLSVFSDNLFSPQKSSADSYKNSGAVTVFCGRDAEDEAKFVAAAIYRLCVLKKRYDFDEITVAVKNISDYSGIFESVFRRFGIPLWIDEKTGLTGRKTAVFLLSFLAAACLKTAETDDFIRILKCGFMTKPDGSEITETEIDNLENFCFTNDIKRRHFLEPFSDSAAEELRLIAVSATGDFCEKTRNGGGKDFIRALCEFAEKCDIKSKIRYAASLDADTLAAERGDIHSWNLLCDLFEDLYDVFPEGEVLPPEEFYRLFEAAAADLRLSSPPQSQGSVTMIKASPERFSSPKVLFICGANDGVFPATPETDGIFTDSDLEELRRRNIIIAGTLEERLADERFSVYAACAAPRERLYISYRFAGESGAPMYPSEIANTAEAVFGKGVVYDNYRLGAEFFCLTAESTYAEFISRFGEKTPDTATIRAALAKFPAYEKRIKLTENAGFSLEKELVGKLYGGVIRFSATGFETFEACPFKFFAKYGLRIFPRRKNDLTPNVRGGLIHDCLKNVGIGIAQNRYDGDFEELLESDIKRFMENFLSEQVPGGKEYKSERFFTDFENLFGAAKAVSAHLIAEFKQSGFVPCEFEYGIGEADTPPLEIISQNGVRAQFRGIADRVDTWGDYLRVIDYKSFDKPFSYDEMYEGINLQPVLYIAALTGGGKYKNDRPAGVIYLFSYEIPPNIPRRSGTDGKQIKTSGAVLSDESVIAAMEKSDNGKFRFIPAKFIKKSGEYKNTITDEQFERLIEFSKNKLGEAAERIGAGECAALPVSEKANSSRACDWCDYFSLCGNYPPLERSRTYRLDNESAKEEILGEANGGTDQTTK